jgi:hypothetical protein
MVRILSPRWPEPTMFFRSTDVFFRTCEFFASSSLSIKARRAEARLDSLLRPCLVSMRPEGTCISLQEFWCLFLCCPPAPEPENHSTLKSPSLRESHTVRLAWSEMTATVTVDVWVLPRRSVGGTLWNRWPPASASNPLSSFPKTRRICVFPTFSSTTLQP